MSRRARALLVVVFASALAIEPTFAAELFGPAAVSFPVSGSLLSGGIGDFDGDGSQDLAVSSGSAAVGILLGDGRGGFTSAPDVAVGDTPVAAAVGDFNADGTRDLAVVNNRDDTVSILQGEGHGGFVRTADVPVGAGPSSVIVDDFNGDGAWDLAVANRNGDSVSILLGDGDGGFGGASEFAAGEQACSIAVGDFNGDGALDLAVAFIGTYYDPGGVSILIGDGLGGFVRTPDLAVGFFPIAVVVGDFNGDGAPDLAVGSFADEPAPGPVSILLGDGDGGFVHTIDLLTGRSSNSSAIVIGDFNADGAQDLAVASDADSTVGIFLGDGRGSFVHTSDLLGGGYPESVVLGDLNGDGAPDLAVAGVDSMIVFLGNGLGGFSGVPDYEVGYNPWTVAVGDFNADGAQDLVITAALDDSVNILLGDGLGGFARAPDLSVGIYPQALAVGDFNGDGAQDLAVVGGQLSVLLGDGHGNFARTPDLEVGMDPVSVAVSDFNGDGAQDLAVANSGSASVSILLGDGDGGFTRTPDLDVDGGASLILAGDFNADGAKDLAVAGGLVSILLGDGVGGFARAPDLDFESFVSAMAIGDLNGDAAQDLAVVKYASDSVSVLLGDGHGGFARAPEVAAGYGSAAIAIGDFNADGAQDLAVTNDESSSVIAFLGDGLGGFARAPGFAVGESPYSIAVGDFNTDRAQDLVVANYFNPSVSILLNQLADRADPNGSNRIDGFDVAAIARLAGAQRCPSDDLGCGSAYQRNEDVNLDGIVDGEDLAVVAPRFGQLRKAVSPLHGAVATPTPPSLGTVTLEQVSSDADLLTVRAFVSDTTHAAAGASFAITFDPTDGATGQVLEVAGFEPGTYLSGAAGQAYDVDTKTPGMAKVTVTRLPNSDQTAPEAQALMSVFLRARRAGQARLDFAPLAYSQPALVTASGQQVPVTFVGGNAVTVDASGGGPPGQLLGFSPDVVNFGAVDSGLRSRRSLRISNFGYSDLEVSGLTSTLPEFSSFFTSTFTVPPYGYIELPVLFTPARKGWFSGDLVIASNDAAHAETRVPVQGTSDASLAVVPDRLTFGNVSAGNTKVLTLKLTNRGTTTLTLTGYRSSDAQFVPQVGFSTLDPGQAGPVTVAFTPAASVVVRGTLTLSFDGADVTTVVVGMVGVGY